MRASDAPFASSPTPVGGPVSLLVEAMVAERDAKTKRGKRRLIRILGSISRFVDSEW